MTTPKPHLSNHEPYRENIIQACEVEASDIHAAPGKPVTPLLDTVNIPEDLRKLQPEQ